MSNEDQVPTSCCSTSPAVEASVAEEAVSAGSSCCGPTFDSDPAKYAANMA